MDSAAEHRFRDLIEGLGAIVWEADAETLRVSFVSREAELLLGYPLDDWLTAPDIWSRIIHPDDYVRVRTAWAAALREGEDPAFEYRAVAADGRILWLRDMTRVVEDETGQAHRLRGILLDVTERRQAEEALRQSERHFRSLIENALDTITVLDREGAILYESPSVERVLGYRPDVLVGQNVFGMVHPDDLRRVLEAFGELVERPRSIRSVSLRFRHRDGSWRNLEATGKNLLDDPVVAGVVVNARDVSERRQLEEQLQQAWKMDAIGRLAGGVAHDFNNLLTAIRGHAQLLLEDLPFADPMHAELRDIGKAAARATSLTRQLLAFSRKQVLQPRVLDLNGVVAEMESMLSRLIGEHITLECVLQHDLGRVEADPGQMEQVLLNLALNARDAMPEGGRLTITTTDAVVGPAQAHRLAYAVEPGEYVRLSMTDTGKGMAASTQAHIFEPFFTTKEQGTGLGLSTVYGIIHQTGGHIRVESEVERGTRFEIYLPRVEADEEPQPSSAVGATPCGSEAILLVEDEETVRSLAHRVLRRFGYDVLGAANGREALDLCKQHAGPIHLVLTDVVMPEMSGHALVEQLLALRPTLRVVYMSGYSEDVIAQQGALERGNAFLPKPFTPQALARLVRDVLDRPAQD